MNLAEWAESVGISRHTAYRWYHEGVLPVPAKKISRTILVNPAGPLENTQENFGLYARVSSHDQKADLERQLTRLKVWATDAGVKVIKSESEIGSGMNGKRSKINNLLSDPKVDVIVVEHRDRLGRMNVELVESALAASGRRLVVLEKEELDHDLVQDMVDVLTSFCARLYGGRSAKARAKRALAAAEKAPDNA